MSLTLDQLNEALDVSRVYMVCVYSVLLWDYLVTFPQEYRLIWKAKWSPAKILFLANRYYSIAQMTLLVVLWWAPIPRHVCSKVFYVEPYSTSIVLALCHGIFFLRTSAIWQWRWSVMAPLLIIIAGEVIAEFLTGSHNILIPGQTKGCISGSGVSWIWAYWGGPLVYDTVTLVLTFVGVWRLQRNAQGAKITPLMGQLLKDGALYFVVVFIVNLLNEIFFLLHNPGIQALHAGLAIVMSTIMASRLVLKMREAGSDRSPMQSAVPRTSFWTKQSAGAASKDVQSFGASNSSPRSPRFTQPPAGLAQNIRLDTVVRHDYDVEKFENEHDDPSESVGDKDSTLNGDGNPTGMVISLENRNHQSRMYHAYSTNRDVEQV